MRFFACSVAVVIFALFVLFQSTVLGNGCVVRQRADYYYPPVQQVYQAPYAATYFQAIPVYSFGYASTDVELQLKLLRAEMELQQLRQENKALQQKTLPEKIDTPKKQASLEHPAVGIMKNKCMACHDASIAKGKGAGFVLHGVEGFVKLSDRQALNIAREVYSGRMPKNNKLTDEEVGQIMNWLDTVK